VFYLVFVLLIVALLSSASAFVLLALKWRLSPGFAVRTAMKIELSLATVLAVNFAGFLIESTNPRPNPQVLFLLMSVANVALSASSWQAIRFASMLLGKKRSAIVDAACLVGIAIVYIVSVYFALFIKSESGMRYDNRAGYLIPSIASAIVGIVCVLAVLRFSSRIEVEWRKTARIAGSILLGISLVSIANETLPLASLLGLAALPLSPFILIGMNSLIVTIVWRSLDERHAEAADSTVPAPGPGGQSVSTGVLFTEEILEEASKRLASRFGLSVREREIAALVLAGNLNTVIADRLFISVFTVKNHIHNIFRKTGAESRIDLMRIANLN
jgi:DNA-binding CsgD family transcriptional regulator